MNDRFVGFLSDDDYRLRIAMTFSPQGEVLVFKTVATSQWEPLMTISAEDALTTSPAGLDRTGTHLYLLDSRNRNTGALRTIALDSGEETTLFATELADVDGAIVHPVEKTVQAVTYTYDRVRIEVLDESIRCDLELLESGSRGEIEITSRTVDDRKWTVAESIDDGPIRFYLYDRDDRCLNYLFSHRRELEELRLAKMHCRVIPARDGRNLVSYLTLPVDSDPQNHGCPDKPLPMVLLVHGGPWYRDYWGFHPEHQLLANRGYAVLSVNFRGSTGFGKEFINAANHEWAGAMHNDLIDAVAWATGHNIALKNKVAIMGGSYGGYAALVGLTFTPTTFACGVDIVGPGNLITLMENPPPYWMPIMPLMSTRVGDHTTENGRKFLESRSQLFHVDQIVRPLLIAQGANDPRVRRAESDQIVAAMRERRIPVTYLLYPDEGHGLDRPENNLSFYAVAEAFLAQHLGGACEPIGDDLERASFEVVEGANQIPELAGCLA
jgi:dipeptidyl aminopeptidase/acylaminoacyl peptidase